MEIEIDLAKLRGCKVFLAAPMYGGGGTGFFMKSCMDAISLFQKHGLILKPFFIFNESLITRARNYIADEFLRSDCTHLMFIDADISFNAEDLLVLLHYSETGEDKDIIAGAYPKKNISWEKIKSAVDQGLADDDPNVLANYTGDFVFNSIKSGTLNLNEPLEVGETGTGFMMIKRSVFEDFAKAYPELQYYPDHKRSENFTGDRKITGFFMDPIYKERHLSEDYFFCIWSRNIGKKIWICPWMNLDHIGTHIFKGNLSAVLSAKMAPTIKASDVRKV